MDKDEFESKLRQTRRQKEQAEQELESASEKWRAERRRLNAEIDRLEAALSEAKEAPKRRGESKPQGIDPVEVAKIQAAANEKLKKATSEWETERERLKSQMVRLEQSLTEAIERSSNPLRATQLVREDLEGRIVHTMREKETLERAVIRERADWEQEKLKLMAELFKLRGAAKMLGRPEPEAPRDDPRVKEFEKKLKEATEKWDEERRRLNDHAGQLQTAYLELQRKLQNYDAASVNSKHYELKLLEAGQHNEALQRQLQKARDDWDAERNRFNSDLRKLEQQQVKVHDHQIIRESAETWAAEKHKLNEHAGQLQNAYLESQTKLKNSEAAVGAMKQEYEAKLQEATRLKQSFEKELQKTRDDWTADRDRLFEDIRQLKQHPQSGEIRTAPDNGVDELKKEYEKKLQAANELLSSERTRLTAEIARVAQTPASSGDGHTHGVLVAEETLNAEIDRIEAMLKDIIILIEDPATELSTVIRKNVERAELDAYLRGILFSTGKSKGL